MGVLGDYYMSWNKSSPFHRNKLYRRWELGVDSTSSVIINFKRGHHYSPNSTDLWTTLGTVQELCPWCNKGTCFKENSHNEKNYMKIRLHHQGPNTFHSREINVTKDLGEKGETMTAGVINPLSGFAQNNWVSTPTK